MYEVGLGDSPMLIAGYLGGDARRLPELIAANPHKRTVLAHGQPTFATLGVGELLYMPRSFVGESLARAFGVGDPQQAYAQLQHTFGTSDPHDAFARIAHTYGVSDCPLREQMFARALAAGLGDVGLGDIFGDIGHAVGGAVNDVGKAAGQAANTVAKVADSAAKEAQKAVSSVAKFVEKAGGDVGKFVSQQAEAIAKDPMGALTKIATGGPLGLVGINVDSLLKAAGLPTGSEMLHKLGLPDPGKLLHDAGLPTDPAEIARDVANPTELLKKIPGIKEVAQYIPAMPDPTKMAENIISAAASGDLNKLKTAVLDVGHTAASMLAMVPGVGSGIAGPLDAGIALLESGSPLRAALDLLLTEIPDIPPQIRDVVLRPAIDAVADIIEKGKSVSDALIASFKEGVLNEAKAQGIPDALMGLIDGFLDGVAQIIFQHKPLDQAAVGFAQKGLDTAMHAALKQVGATGGDLLKHLPSIPGGGDLLKKLPSLPGGGDLLKQLPSLPIDTGDLVKRVSALPGGAALLKQIPSGGDLQKALTQKVFDAVKSKIPAQITNQVQSLQQAYTDARSVADNSNAIHALTQGVIALNKKDPQKKNATVQNQIAGLKAAIAAHRLGIQAGAKKLDTNLGKPVPVHKVIALKLGARPPAPPPPVAPAHVPAPAPAAAKGKYGPYPAHR